MIYFGRLFYVFLVCIFQTAAYGRDITVGSWNLGWHMTAVEADDWIAACSARRSINPASGKWELSNSNDAKPGWDLGEAWQRDAKNPVDWDIGKMAPCNVYSYRSGSGSVDITVTAAAMKERFDKIRSFVAANLNLDVLAFQEVTGREAVKAILPNGGADYDFCDFSGYKVQRMVIAVRKALGPISECAVRDELSLPFNAEKDRPRPGLSGVIQIDGKPLRIMTVHLKSSCVSPLEQPSTERPERGRLEGNDDACLILQKQVVPLEAWLDAGSHVPTLLMGDFNRDLWHERNSIPADKIRTGASDVTGELPEGEKIRSLVGEINDGAPSTSALLLLAAKCMLADADNAALCDQAKSRLLSPSERNRLIDGKNGLGCKYPVGLDHILLPAAIAAGENAIKVRIGTDGENAPSGGLDGGPKLAISDHCPVKATLRF